MLIRTERGLHDDEGSKQMRMVHPKKGSGTHKGNIIVITCHAVKQQSSQACHTNKRPSIPVNQSVILIMVAYKSET